MNGIDTRQQKTNKKSLTERISDFLMDAESEGQCSYSYSCYFNLLSITHASGNCKNLMSSLTANTCPWCLFQSVRGSASDLKAAFWQKREIKKRMTKSECRHRIPRRRTGKRSQRRNDERTLERDSIHLKAADAFFFSWLTAKGT